MPRSLDGQVRFKIDLDTASMIKSLVYAMPYVERFNALGNLMTPSFIGLTLIGKQIWNVGKEFDSAFAEVRKTINATESEFKGLSDAILEMSTKIPVTASELAKMAGLSAQLGIGKDAVLEFTEVIAKLGVATNITTEQDIINLAKFMNQMGNTSIQTKDKIDKVGSAIVDLGNNTATTEKDILTMAQRMASSAKIYGYTESEVLGVAAAFSSLGLRAEHGGTSFAKLTKKLSEAGQSNNEMTKFIVKNTGITTEAFQAMVKSNPAGALTYFSKALANVQKTGGDVGKELADLDIKEIRLNNTAMRLTTGTDLLEKSIARSNTAFAQNNALNKEAQQRFDTVENKAKLFQNTLDKALIATFEKLKPAIKVVIDVLTTLAQAFEKIVSSIPTDAIVPVVGALLMFKVVVPVIGTLKTIFYGFNKELSKNVVGTTQVAVSNAQLLGVMHRLEMQTLKNTGGFNRLNSAQQKAKIEALRAVQANDMLVISNGKVGNAVQNTAKNAGKATGLLSKVGGSLAGIGASLASTFLNPINIAIVGIGLLTTVLGRIKEENEKIVGSARDAGKALKDAYDANYSSKTETAFKGIETSVKSARESIKLFAYDLATNVNVKSFEEYKKSIQDAFSGITDSITKARDTQLAGMADIFSNSSDFTYKEQVSINKVIVGASKERLNEILDLEKEFTDIVYEYKTNTDETKNAELITRYNETINKMKTLEQELANEKERQSLDHIARLGREGALSQAEIDNYTTKFKESGVQQIETIRQTYAEQQGALSQTIKDYDSLIAKTSDENKKKKLLGEQEDLIATSTRLRAEEEGKVNEQYGKTLSTIAEVNGANKENLKVVRDQNGEISEFIDQNGKSIVNANKVMKTYLENFSSETKNKIVEAMGIQNFEVDKGLKQQNDLWKKGGAENATNFLTGIKNNLQNGLDGTKVDPTRFNNAIYDALKGNETDLLAIGGDYGTGIINGLRSKDPEVRLKARGLIESMTGEILDPALIAEFQKAGFLDSQALSDGFGLNTSNLQTAGSNGANAIKTGIGSQKQVIFGAGGNLGTGFATNFQSSVNNNPIKFPVSNLSTITANFATTGATAGSLFNTNLANSKGAVTTTTNQLAQLLPTSLNSQLPNITSASTKMATAITTPLRSADFNGKLSAISRNTVNGVLRDIDAGTGVGASVQKFANRLVTELKAKLDIHSPSRVMANEIGKWIPAGVGVGIESGTNKLGKYIDAQKEYLVEKYATVGDDIDKVIAGETLGKATTKVLSKVKVEANKKSVRDIYIDLTAQNANAMEVYKIMKNSMYDDIDKYLGGAL